MIDIGKDVECHPHNNIRIMIRGGGYEIVSFIILILVLRYKCIEGLSLQENVRIVQSHPQEKSEILILIAEKMHLRETLLLILLWANIFDISQTYIQND